MLDLFYNLCVFFIIFILYELTNFKETQQYVKDMHTPSENDEYIPQLWSGRFFVDFMIFLWLSIGVIVNLIWYDSIVNLFLLISAVAIIQFVLFAIMTYNDKKYIIWYYIFNMLYLTLFIIIFINKQTIF